MLFRHSIPRLRKGFTAGGLALLLAVSLPALPAEASFLRISSGQTMAAHDFDLTPVREDLSPTEEVAVTLEEAAELLDESAYIPHVWPVHFSESGLITSYFGYRVDPVSGDYIEYHQAIDLADSPNSKIYASASGTVTEAGYHSGYGLTMVIDHGNGYTTRYSHCNSLLFAEGDTVVQGEIIAMMGATGKATGTHLDFRVTLDGVYLDPLDLLDSPDSAD